MGKLTDIHFKAVANAVKQRRQVTLPLNKTWQAIYEVAVIGELNQQRRKLILSSVQLKELRQIIQDICKVDVLNYSLDIERVEMTAQGADDKLAKIKPEDDFVLFKTLGVTFNSLPFTKACSMRVKVDELLAYLEQESIQAIMVVENLDVFDRINEFELLFGKKKTLVIYRGDSKHSPSGVKKFLLNIPSDKAVIAFTDFDPDGLKIALTLPSVTAVLLPIPIEEMRNINQIDDYVKQSGAVKFLNDNCPGSIVQDWSFMRTHRLSIKQQTMLSRKMPLKLITFT
ncbi:MAG: hypothetical protein HAW66_04045 [Shewanella sp.]|nr:hypothetical protein [Shewanella sp.]